MKCNPEAPKTMQETRHFSMLESPNFSCHKRWFSRIIIFFTLLLICPSKINITIFAISTHALIIESKQSLGSQVGSRRIVLHMTSFQLLIATFCKRVMADAARGLTVDCGVEIGKLLNAKDPTSKICQPYPRDNDDQCESYYSQFASFVTKQ